MTLIRITGLSAAICFTASCEKHQESINAGATAIEWIVATNDLEEYAAETQGQPTVALFTKNWDLIGDLFKRHIEANQNTLFPNTSPKFLEYDCSDGSKGTEQLSKAGIAYLPVVFIYIGKEWQHTGPPRDFLQDPNSDNDYLRELRRVISAAKEAEQASSSNGG